MSEQRDQWGETAEERQSRILARDLAWMTYAEACARDGVPRSERDHLIFNDGYAAGRADYLPGAGVVAEEPEWEAEYAARTQSGHLVLTDARGACYAGETPMERKVTPWVPVKQEGETNGPAGD